MKVVQVTALEGPSSLAVAEVDEPVASPGQLLVDVHAAGVCFPDLLLTRGQYQLKPPVPFVPGVEAAGVVRESGHGFEAGDRVALFLGLGGWAQTIAVDPGQLFRLPDSMSMTGGAGLLMNTLTCHFALVTRGQLIAGETVLILGAAGGVGTSGIQVAKAQGARVIAVVSTEAKALVAKAAGADEVLVGPFTRESVAAVKALTEGRGVDVVLDPVGGDIFLDVVRSLAVQGRLVVVGFAAGSIPTLAMNRLLLNNISVVGAAWGAYLMSAPGYLAEQTTALQKMITDGFIQPVDGAVFDLEHAADALELMDSRGATGKVTLSLR